eukprot:gene26602-18373_t
MSENQEWIFPADGTRTKLGVPSPGPSSNIATVHAGDCTSSKGKTAATEDMHTLMPGAASGSTCDHDQIEEIQQKLPLKKQQQQQQQQQQKQNPKVKTCTTPVSRVRAAFKSLKETLVCCTSLAKQHTEEFQISPHEPVEGAEVMNPPQGRFGWEASPNEVRCLQGHDAWLRYEPAACSDANRCCRRFGTSPAHTGARPVARRPTTGTSPAHTDARPVARRPTTGALTDGRTRPVAIPFGQNDITNNSGQSSKIARTISTPIPLPYRHRGRSYKYNSSSIFKKSTYNTHTGPAISSSARTPITQRSSTSSNGDQSSKVTRSSSTPCSRTYGDHRGNSYYQGQGTSPTSLLIPKPGKKLYGRTFNNNQKSVFNMHHAPIKAPIYVPYHQGLPNTGDKSNEGDGNRSSSPGYVPRSNKGCSVVSNAPSLVSRYSSAVSWRSSFEIDEDTFLLHPPTHCPYRAQPPSPLPETPLVDHQLSTASQRGSALTKQSSLGGDSHIEHLARESNGQELSLTAQQGSPRSRQSSLGGDSHTEILARDSNGGDDFVIHRVQSEVGSQDPCVLTRTSNGAGYRSSLIRRTSSTGSGCGSHAKHLKRTSSGGMLPMVVVTQMEGPFSTPDDEYRVEEEIPAGTAADHMGVRNSSSQAEASSTEAAPTLGGAHVKATPTLGASYRSLQAGDPITPPTNEYGVEPTVPAGVATHKLPGGDSYYVSPPTEDSTPDTEQAAADGMKGGALEEADNDPKLCVNTVNTVNTVITVNTVKTNNMGALSKNTTVMEGGALEEADKEPKLTANTVKIVKTDNMGVLGKTMKITSMGAINGALRSPEDLYITLPQEVPAGVVPPWVPNPPLKFVVIRNSFFVVYSVFVFTVRSSSFFYVFLASPHPSSCSVLLPSALG